MAPDSAAILSRAETIVIGNKDPAFDTVPEQLSDHQVLVDFVRISNRRSENGKYAGICW